MPPFSRSILNYRGIYWSKFVQRSSKLHHDFLLPFPLNLFFSLNQNYALLFSIAVLHYGICLLPLSFATFTQVLQMYLPFCGISISNAKLFSESRKEYERSRVRECKLCLHKSISGCFYNSWRIHSSTTSILLATGSAGGGQWPVWRADRPGEDCQEDHAESADPAAVWTLLCAPPRRHWLTCEALLSFLCLFFFCLTNSFFFTFLLKPIAFLQQNSLCC